MSRLLNLELPPVSVDDPEFLRLLNERLLRISEELHREPDLKLTIQGQHVERLGQYKPENQQAGRLFWEKDRNSVYVIREVKKIHVWAWESGFYADVIAKRPDDLGRYDAGFLFFAKDQKILYWWDGEDWVKLLSEFQDSTDGQQNYSGQIEDLQRQLSSIESAPNPRAELEDLRRLISSIEESRANQIPTLTIADIPDLSSLYASVGYPGVYASVALTLQTATIGTTNIQRSAAILPAGVYRVSAYLTVTSAGGGNVSVTLGWNDGAAAQTDVLGPAGMGTTGRKLVQSLPYRLDGSNNLTYATTVTAGGGTYRLDILVERLS